MNNCKITPSPEAHCCVYIEAIPATDLMLTQKAALRSQFALQTVKRAYLQQWNLNFDALHPRRLSNGKWVCDKGYFSISHSGDYVAVALANVPVGVDIQRYSGAKIRDIARKFFTEAESAQFQNAADKTDCFYFTWCKKEALWKSLQPQPPTVVTVETTEVAFTTQKLTLNGETYYLAVTGEAKIEQKDV